MAEIGELWLEAGRRRQKVRNFSRSNITSTTLGWSRGLSSYEIKSLILISHSRLACNCLGSRRLSPLCRLTVRRCGRVWLGFAPWHSWIIVFRNVEIKAGWFNILFFVFLNSRWLHSPSPCNTIKTILPSPKVWNNHWLYMLRCFFTPVAIYPNSGLRWQQQISKADSHINIQAIIISQTGLQLF